MKLLFIFIVLELYSIHATNCPGKKEENPTEPCAPSNDIECVHKHFYSFGNCKDFDRGNDGDVLVKNIMKLSVPFFNMSITQEGVTIKGLSSGQITKFIVDYKTDLSVLSVKYTNLSINADSTNFIYYKLEYEPKEMITATTELYSEVYITSYFYGAKNPQLSNSYHVASVSSKPSYSLGSCFGKNTDPEMMQLFKKFTTMVAAPIQESFLTRGTTFQTQWIQNNICNYGL